MKKAGGRSCRYHSGPTGLSSSIIIYRKRGLILWEICHNIKMVRCLPPVTGAFPRPLGRPVRHREINSLSYLASRRVTLQSGVLGRGGTAAESRKDPIGNCRKSVEWVYILVKKKLLYEWINVLFLLKEPRHFNTKLRTYSNLLKSQWSPSFSWWSRFVVKNRSVLQADQLWGFHLSCENGVSRKRQDPYEQILNVKVAVLLAFEFQNQKKKNIPQNKLKSELIWEFHSILGRKRKNEILLII